MGLFDMFDSSKKVEQMLDILLEASGEFMENMNSKTELLSYLKMKRIEARVSQSSIHWECRITNEPWSFFVEMEDGEIVKDKQLYGKYFNLYGTEEFSKFGNVDFNLKRGGLPFFSISSPLPDLPIPKKARVLASAIKQRGYSLLATEEKNGRIKIVDL
jgi:hypothetical protein